jgi:hypothetical protein
MNSIWTFRILPSLLLGGFFFSAGGLIAQMQPAHQDLIPDGALNRVSGLGVQTQAPHEDIVDGAEVLKDETGPYLKDRFLVFFKTRSFNLEGLRQAILSGKSKSEVFRILETYREGTKKDRAAFNASIVNLGGKVIQNFWVINASSVLFPEAKLEVLKGLPGVAKVDRDRVYSTLLSSATNSSHHNSDAANQMKDANGKQILGTGVGVAVIDTGADTRMGTSGRAHRLYFRNGNPNSVNRLKAALGAASSSDVEDIHSHGTMVTHCAAGADWSSSSIVDNGFAPDANIVSIKVTIGSGGSTSGTILIRAWQMTLSNRMTFGIKVANNSFSGSPRPTDGIQQAMDSTAYNGDIFIALPSGNTGANISRSQNGFNAVTVGSINKGSLATSSFTSYGSTSLGKVIPDLAAVGASVNMALRDRETSIARASGTSFSSPMAAGAGALLRQANPKLTALETKALLLNNVLPNTSSISRGVGVMRADFATKAALNKNVVSDKLSSGSTKKNFFFQVQQGATHSVTVTWFRKVFSTNQNDNLDLRVYDAKGNLLGTSARNFANSFEKVTFTAPRTETYRAEVTGALTNSSIDFAIAGAGQPIPPKPPVLSSLSPKAYSAFDGKSIVLTGSNLQTVTKILMGNLSMNPDSVSKTTVSFSPPLPTSLGALGSYSVKVVNPAGTSNALQLRVDPSHPPKLFGPGLLTTFKTVDDDLWTDNGWIGIYYVSITNKPSVIPGVVSLGIGNQFSILLPFGTFVGDKVGHSSLRWLVPFGLAGQTFHWQAVVLDPKNVKFPLEVTKVLTRKVLF